MERKIAWVVGCLILYLVLLMTFGGVINIILLMGGIAYFIYKNN